eukprot:scaffold72985_cov69-Phaeocystis_antarctica.AAC.2
MAPSASSAQSPSGRRRSGDLENAAPSAWSGISRFGFKKRAASTRSRTEQATTEAPSGNVKQTKAACPPLDLKPDSGAARAITRATPRLVENIKVTADKYGRRALKGANLAAPWRRQTWQQSAVELHYSSTMHPRVAGARAPQAPGRHRQTDGEGGGAMRSRRHHAPAASGARDPACPYTGGWVKGRSCTYSDPLSAC